MDDNQGSSDEALMNAYCRGSESAFLQLYARYQEKVFTFLRLSLGRSRSHLNEEIFQKTWLKVHQARHSFEGTRRFSPWLFTIAMNTLRDEVGLAREKRHHESIDEILLVSDRPLPDELFSHAEMMQKVNRHLEELPQRQREAVLLVDLEGFSSLEASEMLSMTHNGLRQLLFRARKSLREIFSLEEK